VWDVFAVSADPSHDPLNGEPVAAQFNESWWVTIGGETIGPTPDLPDHMVVASFYLGSVTLSETVDSVTFEHVGYGSTPGSVWPAVRLVSCR
jgi:hypothetical protein